MLASNIILIEGEAARDFLESARHPDPEMIRKRDAMFDEWDAVFDACERAELLSDIQEEQEKVSLVTYVPTAAYVVCVGGVNCTAYESDRAGGASQTEWSLPIAAAGGASQTEWSLPIAA